MNHDHKLALISDALYYLSKSRSVIEALRSVHRSPAITAAIKQIDRVIGALETIQTLTPKGDVI